MTLHPLDGVHLRDALEHLLLTDIQFVLHPQLISCIHACGIDGKCFQTTFSPPVPSLSTAICFS